MKLPAIIWLTFSALLAVIIVSTARPQPADSTESGNDLRKSSWTGSTSETLYRAKQIPKGFYTEPFVLGTEIYLTCADDDSDTKHFVVAWDPISEHTRRITPPNLFGRVMAASDRAILVAEWYSDGTTKQMVLVRKNGERLPLPLEYLPSSNDLALVGETVYVGSYTTYNSTPPTTVPPRCITTDGVVELKIPEGADGLHFRGGHNHKVIGHFSARGPAWFYSMNVNRADVTDSSMTPEAREQAREKAAEKLRVELREAMKREPLLPFEWACVLDTTSLTPEQSSLQRVWRSQFLATNGTTHVGIRSPFGLDQIRPYPVPVCVTAAGVRLLPIGSAQTGIANGISADGQLIVGEIGEYGSSNCCPVAVLWQQEHAPIALEQAATGLADYQLHTATAIYENGWVIAFGATKIDPRGKDAGSYFVLMPTTPN